MFVVGLIRESSRDLLNVNVKQVEHSSRLEPGLKSREVLRTGMSPVGAKSRLMDTGPRAPGSRRVRLAAGVPLAADETGQLSNCQSR